LKLHSIVFKGFSGAFQGLFKGFSRAFQGLLFSANVADPVG
jgi:hypothetical protein